MKALIHVGANKTGSTSVQESLHASRDELLAAGILYPNLNRRDHRDLVLGFKERPENVKARKRGLTREQAVKLGRAQAAMLDSQLTQLSPELVILSSEFFLPRARP